jgi:hypothetical protein
MMLLVPIRKAIPQYVSCNTLHKAALSLRQQRRNLLKELALWKLWVGFPKGDERSPHEDAIVPREEYG